jgi:PAS domain-containing protein
MSSRAIEPAAQRELRLRAASSLAAPGSDVSAHATASSALGVLYELASSPSTAPAALALLHELQVHQVELEMQEEELRRSRLELERALARQVLLYDAAPVCSFTVDGAIVLQEMNRTGANLLGAGRESLLGHSFGAYLAPHSEHALRTLLARASETRGIETAFLHVLVPGNAPRVMHASASADPSGDRYLLALVAIGDPDVEASPARLS